MSEVKNYSKTDLPDNWEMGEFSKDLKIQGRIGWKGYKTSDLVDEGPIVVGGTEIKSSIRLSLDNVKHLSREKYEESPEIMLKEGDVLLVTRGNLGEVGYYHSEYGEGTINPSVIILKNFKGDSKYLFYYLISSIGKKQVLSLTSGSSIPAIYQSEVYKLNYPKPPITEQKSIAAILTSFDDKIELLQAQNKTLEELAQTIFKEWFGKYQIGDELPEGWQVEELDGLLELVIDYRGKTPLKLGMDWSENGIPALSAKSIKNGKIVRRDAMNFGSEELYSIWMKDELKKGDILLTSEAPLGEMYYLNDDTRYILSQRLFALRVNQQITSEYLYHYLYSTNGQTLLQARASGSTVEGIRQSELRKIEVIVPDKNILEKASIIFKNVFDKTFANEQQIQTLTKTRDELLPKLMSGEIRVKMSEL